ncbi:6-phospho-3-hexuloisomerase [Oceanobacillus senegalensis]|uniref:6-phospho-3-hexuloisomerase n=1 Tax=Oceanobacillus senegalensis TaxID=1936063 RepID=UPI000A30D6C3|nr:6-phospho-3-hexuloisomerase [Oceanobacillus senegalensis]
MEVETSYTGTILKELEKSLLTINDEELEELADEILQAKKVFVAGAGRSGLMAKAFAMRMMHIGLEAYVVGETVTPNLEEDDLLIVGSGSGGTKTLAVMAEKAKSIGAKVALITINPESPIGHLADFSVKINAQAKDNGDSQKSIQPMGSLFEQSLLLFYDAVILKLMSEKGLTSDTMYGRHANLE